MLLNNYVVNETGCWLWRGKIVSNGYARAGAKYVHRLHCEHKHGPIPKGKDVDHLCRVRHCVNPDHLEIVSRARNLRRGVGVRLSETLVWEIRVLYAIGLLVEHSEYGNITTRRLADLYKVGKSTIFSVISCKYWVEDLCA